MYARNFLHNVKIGKNVIIGKNNIFGENVIIKIFKICFYTINTNIKT